MIAAEYGQAEAAGLLLEAEVDAGVRNSQNRRAEDIAVQHGFPGLAELLR